ncbi:MAG: PHP domain-containing protein [Spirochaetales bacterium]|nr:PHP domain-containing protein [Spirochaetales bacterium]
MIDLHTHSTQSDGTNTPKELIRLAVKQKLKAIALTDHDTIAGLKEAAREAKKLNIIFIPGIEMELEYPDGEFHMLGLGITKPDKLKTWIEKLKSIRQERNKKMIKIMKKAGIKVTMARLRKIAGGKIIAKPHFAELLVKAGKVKTVAEAFALYLRRGMPFYVEKENVSFEKAIKAIHKASGRAVLAHPRSLRLEWDDLAAFIRRLKGMGLDGVEVFHPKCPSELSARLETLAQQENLLMTAGSDFHGKFYPDRKLSYTGSGKRIPYRFVLPFLQK